MMAEFPSQTIGTTEEQDRTDLRLVKKTFPGGCNCSYANWTLVGIGMMTHTWDNFHKDDSLLSTSLE